MAAIAAMIERLQARPASPALDRPRAGSSSQRAKPSLEGRRFVSQSVAHTTLDDPLQEALRLVQAANDRGLTVRLMGGLAFHALVPEWTARVQRARRDIDLATRGKDSRAVAEWLGGEGYVGDKQYNALYGHKQLYFVDPEHDRPLDVLVERLEMCHRFEFGDLLGRSYPTIPPTELLLSKLQIVKINRKDVLDALALLANFELSADDRDGPSISLKRITALSGNDWGWWRTITGNLTKLGHFVEAELQPGELDFGRPPRFGPREQLEALGAAIEAAPKSTRWRLRARVGDRVAWYEEPEEVGHGR